MRLYLSIFIFLTAHISVGQVTADFTLPAEVCLEENFQIENTSLNASSYEWDFCPDDINQTPLTTSAISSFINVWGYKIIRTELNIYVFILSENNLIKQVYDHSFENLQSSENLGSFGLINNPDGIDIYKDSSGDWVGLIGHRNNGGGYITRLVWDNLDNTPLAENIGNLGLSGRIRDVKIVQDGTNYFGVFPYYNSPNLLRVSFGNSLKNSFTNADITTSSSLPNVQFAIGMDIINLEGEWFVALSSLLTKTISIFNLGTSITNPPVEVKSQSFTSLGNVLKFKYYQNYNGTIYGFWTTDNKTQIIDLKDLSASANFEIIPSDLPQSIAIDYLEHLGKISMISGTTSQNISQFESLCTNGQFDPFSIDFEPTLYFNQSGTYPIKLTVFHTDGTTDSTTKELIVSENAAPTGEIILDPSYCIANPINFEFNTTDVINAYLWDFGDGTSSTNSAPSKSYSTEGEYIISLVVENALGCSSTFKDTLNVYPLPNPTFSTSKSEYCSFEQITFNYNDSFDYGSNIVFNWNFNGEGSSSEENPNFTFDNAGIKTITLEVDVFGCIQSFESSLQIIDGPQPDFTFNSSCLNEPIQFLSLSSGANIISYDWDFGDGQTSIDENPQHIFSSPGQYSVSLSVSNSNGCQTSSIKNIRIYDEIIEKIESTKPIENIPFKLGIDWKNDFDSTQNLQFNWIINDITRTSDTAEYLLSKGNYNASLEVVTANNCLFSRQFILEVLESEEPIVDYSLPQNVCLNEKFQLENNSINADSYTWDFCPDDINQVPITNSSISDFINVWGYKIIRTELNIYVFILSENNLIKQVYDDAFENLLSSENLGDFGLINNPDGIDIYQDSNGDWVGLIGHRNNGGGYIIRLVWDNLDSTPLAENIGNLGLSGRIRDVKIIQDGSNYFGVFPYYNSPNLLRVDFGNSLKNSFTNTDITNSLSLPNVEFAIGMDIIKVNGNWIVALSSLLTKTISIFNLGSSITNEPIEVKSQSFVNLGNVLKLKIHRNYNGNFYGFWSTENKTELINLKDMSASSNFELIESDLPESIALDYIQHQGRISMVSGTTSQNISVFESVCTNEEIDPYSIDFQPCLFYSQPGTYPITLAATHPNGNTASITKEITVTNNQAPNITYAIGDNLCISNPIQFSSQSTANISSYNWDFGDGNTSTAENPAYNYSTPGDYEVRLNVTDANGCNNLFVDTVSVYAEPVADFQATAQGSICSQKPIVFENLTSLPTTATFEWDLGDGTTSTEENPVHEYAAAGDYTITQIINMAGCVVERTKTITVNPGPLVSFETNNNCLGEIIQFANTSEGEFLDNYTWDLGDGTQTTQANPSHQYDTAGVYQVQLTAFTTNGCDFTITQEVEISPLANVAFEADVACANQATQFTQLVTVDQSNITDYLWDFGVAGVQTDISSEADPEFIFPEAGTYEVGLQVTTSDGCTSFSSQSITVNEVPNAEFDAENNCIGQLRKFTPQDTINSISHFWELRDNVGSIVQTSQETVFEYQFDVEGTYELTYRQENENLCSSTNSHLIEIYEEPLPDFSWDKACVGTAIQIDNLSDLKGNSLKSYNWSIDGTLQSSALNPEFIFEDTGSYEIDLILETQSGCSQNISKIIDVKPSPESFFQLNQKVGAYPFDIATTAGNAENISSVLWTLDGDSISSNQELTYTINEVGTYLLGLRLVNSEGCVDEYFEQVKVREPSLDVALNNLTVNEDDEFTSFILNIKNRGSLVPERIDLRIDLGSYEVTETVNAPIYPEDNRNYSLSLKLTEEQRKGLKKICIEASAKSSIIDEDNLVNNKVCTNLESGFQVLEIYPNPAISQITIPIITPESDVLSFRLEDSNGKNINNFNYSLEAGYNEISFQRDNISSGVYFLRFRFQGEEVIKKLIFQ